MTIASPPAAPAARRAPPARHRAIGELVRFELRVHRRDFLTWLAVLVFVLLTVGYAADGVIALVDRRGPVPRNAPWALAHAMAGVTAFGQVITAMIAATTVLRDVGTRTQGLLLATPIGWRTYLAGRYAGALLVLLLVHAAIPAGLVGGTLLALARGDASLLPFDPVAFAWPLAVLVLPNVLLVSAAFFAAGALSGGFAVILFVGIGLVGLWQTGIALVQAGMPWGTLVDPFGNAALMTVTAEWSEAARTERHVPLAMPLLLNRVAWMALGAVALGLTLQRWRPRLASGEARVPSGGAADDPDATIASAAMPGTSDPATPAACTPLRGAPWRGVLAAEWRFGWRWVRHERGAGVLVGLAVANAIVNGWRHAGDPSALLPAIEFHSRLFGILVATIYAGELVWRDRDARADALLAAVPASASLRLAGRTAGVVAALLVLPVALWGVAVVLPLLRGAAPAPSCAARWLLGASAPAFAGLLLASLAVHVVVRHKTVAHLLCITAWVAAIALGVRALAGPWPGYGAC